MVATWMNYKTVADHMKDITGNQNCRKLCSGCAKPWTELTGMVHMREATQKSPCGLLHEFLCDQCIETKTQTNE